MAPTLQEQFLAQAQHLAVYGLKRNGKGFAHDVVRELRRLGQCTMSAVHPDAPELAGLTVAPSASQLRPAPDAALIVLKSSAARVAIEDAAAAGIKQLWLAFDAANGGNADYARSRGLAVVSGCPLLFVSGSAFPHNFHRALARLFGRV